MSYQRRNFFSIEFFPNYSICLIIQTFWLSEQVLVPMGSDNWGSTVMLIVFCYSKRGFSTQNLLLIVSVFMYTLHFCRLMTLTCTLTSRYSRVHSRSTTVHLVHLCTLMYVVCSCTLMYTPVHPCILINFMLMLTIVYPCKLKFTLVCSWFSPLSP